MFRGSRQSRARGNGRRRGQGRDRERQLREEEEEGEVTDLSSGADDLSGDFNEAPRSGSRQETSRGGQRGRQGRQLGGGGGVGSCKTTGYESRIRDDCKNEFETQCKVIQETKFRTEIDQQCRTKVALSFLQQRVNKCQTLMNMITWLILSWIRNARKSHPRFRNKSVNPDMKKGELELE